MLVFLLTAPLLAFPVSIAFSPVAGEEAIRPWFGGLGGGLIVVLAEAFLRATIEVAVSPGMLFLQMAVTETALPIALAVGLFFLLAGRSRAFEPQLQELSLAAFLSGAFTIRSLYHALFVLELAGVYWAFIMPALAVATVLLVPRLVSLVRTTFGWMRVLAVSLAVAMLAAFTVVPMLWELRFRGVSVFLAGAYCVGGLASWIIPSLGSRGMRARS
jgi:hypothetical protein